MPHQHFYRFSADNHFDLGLAMGKAFAAEARADITKARKIPKWSRYCQTAQKLWDISQAYFPQYLEELAGYAQGAGVDQLDLWTLAVEDDAYLKPTGAHCTTVLTNNGLLLAQNEDTDNPGQENTICVVEKEIAGTKTLEIFYYNTLGGTSVGVNSHGFAQGVNTLLFVHKKLGVPKALQSRYLLDTKNPERAIAFIAKLPRATGYNHLITSQTGKSWDVEFGIGSYKLIQPDAMFAHSNHCVLNTSAPVTKDLYGTVSRLDQANRMLKPQMTEAEVKTVLDDDSQGPKNSIHNERNLGKMIVNFETMTASIWMLREADKGWVSYPLWS